MKNQCTPAVAQPDPLNSPALRPRPTKLFVETTTRCNMGCVMCVKQTCGHAIDEGDMSLPTFAALEPAFPGLEALVLNGVGEPLLNPNLELFVKRARFLMPKTGWIGFQSNGILLSEARAIALLDAGLDKICISIDSISPETFRKVREGGELDEVRDAFSAIASAKIRTGRSDFQVGVEFVVMQGNLQELPAALAWAASRGASFALVTHVLPYDADHADHALYGNCTDQAFELFQGWKREAARQGIDLSRYFELALRYKRTEEDKRLLRFVEAMKAEAEKSGIALDLKKLMNQDHRQREQLTAVFEQAQQVADESGMDLKLPEVLLKETRSCSFIEEGGAFITWNGSVSPCYFLWHRYRCFASGWEQQVQTKVFGNVNFRNILEIWNDEPFRTFREGVLAYDYPHCASCSLAPCDYIQTESFEQDCHIREVPCGACLWCTGIFHCLS